MHIKLCVDPVIPKRKKRKKNSAIYKNVDLYAFLADLKRDPLQHVSYCCSRGRVCKISKCGKISKDIKKL